MPEFEELLSRIAAVPMITRKPAEDMFAGGFGSVYSGSGIDFDSVRRYERGDDIRTIDRNVSARFACPYVKLFREERETAVLCIIDDSQSMSGDSPGLKSRERAALAVALIEFSALRSSRPAGAVFFDKSVTKVFPPRRGRTHVSAIIRAALDINDDAGKKSRRGSALGEAIERALRMLKRRTQVFVISDFFASGWESEFTALARTHDVLALNISPAQELPGPLFLTLNDTETGRHLAAPSRPGASFSAAWEDFCEKRDKLLQAICRRAGAGFLEIKAADEDPVKTIADYFAARATARSA